MVCGHITYQNNGGQDDLQFAKIPQASKDKSEKYVIWVEHKRTPLGYFLF